MMRTSQRKTAETATSRTGRCRLRIIGVPFFCRRLQGSVLNPREPFREPGALSIGGPPPSTRARLTSSRNVTLTRLGHRLRLAGARGLGERDWRPNSLSVSNSARRLFCGQRQGGAEALVLGPTTCSTGQADPAALLSPRAVTPEYPIRVLREAAGFRRALVRVLREARSGFRVTRRLCDAVRSRLRVVRLSARRRPRASRPPWRSHPVVWAGFARASVRASLRLESSVLRPAAWAAACHHGA